MAANSNPIFQRLGDISTNTTTGMSQLVTTADNDYTGVGTHYVLVFTADSTNGSWIERIRMKAGGSNIASVARVFINNGSSHTSATNNAFYGEVSLPGTTAIATAATIEIDYPMGFALNPSFTIYVGLGTTVASGWVFTAIGGPY
jgi:hypothetical protein